MDMISPVELGGPQLFSESGSVAVSDPDNSTLHESQMEVKAMSLFYVGVKFTTYSVKSVSCTTGIYLHCLQNS